MPNKVASPYSTGGGGVNFEDWVATHYLVSLLTKTKSVARGLEAGITKEVRFQRLYEGEPLDDLIIIAQLQQGKAKLALQIKSDLTFGKENEKFTTVIQDCWKTLKSEKFNLNIDRFGIVIRKYKTIYDDYQSVLTWAKNSASHHQFFERIDKEGLSNQNMRNFVGLIRGKLQQCTNDLSQEDLFNFLKSMVILHFDFQQEGSRDKNDLTNETNYILKNQNQEILSFLLQISAETKSCAGEYNRDTLLIKLHQHNYFLADEYDHSYFINYLENSYQESIARCEVKWTAIGISETKARELARNLQDLSISFEPNIKANKINLLIGDIGSGKSLTIEKLLQKFIRKCQNEVNSPIPIYIGAKSLEQSLEDKIKEITSEIKDIKKRGYILIIDELDEKISQISEILKQSEIILRNSENTTIIIASRPLPYLEHKEIYNILDIPELSQQEIFNIVKQVLDYSFWEYDYLHLPLSIQEASQRPLFAILLGIYLKQEDNQILKSLSVGKLVSTLIEKSLGRYNIDQLSANQLLQKLAVAYIENENTPIYRGDIALGGQLRDIIESRLVIEKDKKLSFPLQIIAEWFAVQSLENSEPSCDKLCQDSETLERWKYTIITAIAEFGSEKSFELLTPIVKKYPAIAAEIINLSIQESFPNLPPSQWQKCGQQIRQAMQTWVEGIGQPLAQLIAPVKEDRRLKTLGIRLENRQLTRSWTQGNKDSSDVVKMPTEKECKEKHIWLPRQTIGLNRYKSFINFNNSLAWAWKLTLEDLKQELTRIFKNRTLPLDQLNNDWINHESLWQLARRVLKASSIYINSFSYYPRQKRIILDDLDKVLSTFDPQFQSFSYGYVKLYRHELDLLQKKVTELKNQGEISLLPPWPMPDKECDIIYEWPSKCYQPQTIGAYVEKLYQEALNVYQQAVKTWFSTIANRLRIYSMLPVRLNGLIELGKNETFYFECLPCNSQTSVNIQLCDYIDNIIDEFKVLEDLEKKKYAYRSREQIKGIGESSIGGICYKPFMNDSLTELVYEWLWRDITQALGIPYQSLNNPPKEKQGWL